LKQTDSTVHLRIMERHLPKKFTLAPDTGELTLP